MKKLITVIGLLTILFVLGIASVHSQHVFRDKGAYQDYLDQQRGNKPYQKPLDSFDRKRSILNVGNVEARIRNAATLGYDRDGKCYEFPAGGGITYRWTMAPLVGALVNGEKWVACGTYGAARGFEDEFEPIGGLDGGWSDSPKNNFGIAASDRPDTWPASWPADAYMPPVGSQGFPGILDGEVVATRELYFAVTDDKNNTYPNTIRIDLWGIQYEDFINEDFIIYKMLVTNITSDTLKEMYIGMHDDPDTPEQGSQEWTDDYAAFIAPGDDVEGYSESEDSLLWNFAYLWDGDDRVEGLIANKVGWVALKILETPINPATGEVMGLTTLDVFEYSNAPQTNITEYDQLASGIKPPDNVDPHPDDWTQTPNTYGPDITYVVASGPFDLAPGETLNFALASIHGVNKKDLFNNAMLCQILYNNNYAAAEAPPEPEVHAVAGDHSVTLYWSGYNTENAIYADHVGDKLTGNNAFEGYMIFKSMDRGLTWGDEMINVSGAPMGYIPLAQYDLPNGIQGESDTRQFFWLGDDTGLTHTFTDNNVQNGYEYWYAVVAYDHDDGPIPPLANARKKDAGTAGDNTVKVVPRADVSGFQVGSVGDVSHTAGSSDGVPVATVVDQTAIVTATYEITCNLPVVAKAMSKITLSSNTAPTKPQRDGSSLILGDEAESWTVTNTTTGQIPLSGGMPVDGWPFYDDVTDNAPIFDGIHLAVPPVSMGWKTAQWTTGGNADAGFYLYSSWGGYYDYMTTDDYEFRWTGTPGALGVYDAPGIPFDIYNLTQDAACSHYMWDDDEDGAYSHWDRVMVVEPDGGWTWVFRFWPDAEEPAAGDVYTVITNKPYFAEDKYQFSTTEKTHANVKESGLSKITTVPNPFSVSSRFEIGAYGTEKEVQFHHLPLECTIRIYNMAGDLIVTLEHNNGTPIEAWNLQSFNGQEVAFGIYFYHIDAPGIGEHIGKMAIIK